MTVRYLDDNGVIASLATVTNVQPVKNGIQLLLDHATTPKVINTNALIDIKP